VNVNSIFQPHALVVLWASGHNGWDEVGPNHPFLYVRIQVPLRPYLAAALPP
jgi:hypothetical protein